MAKSFNVTKTSSMFHWLCFNVLRIFTLPFIVKIGHIRNNWCSFSVYNICMNVSKNEKLSDSRLAWLFLEWYLIDHDLACKWSSTGLLEYLYFSTISSDEMFSMQIHDYCLIVIQQKFASKTCYMTIWLSRTLLLQLDKSAYLYILRLPNF